MKLRIFAPSFTSRECTSMFGKIRQSIGEYYYRKEASRAQHPRKMVNLGDARSIGILYTLDDVPDYERVEKFVSELQHDRKEVKALGFVANKNLVTRFLPKLSYDFFSRKDLTWYRKPVHHLVKDFMDKEFDILINLSPKDFFPFHYIAGLSNAWCRVGCFSDRNVAFYDLMIEMGQDIPVPEYIEQIRHYLTVINDHEKRI